MPKKGKKKKNSKNKGFTRVRPLLQKEAGQEYALVTKMLGDRYIMTYCYDGVKRRAHIRGKMRRRVWINVDDIILVSLRDFSETCSDVIHKYDTNEVHRLKKMGELMDIGKTHTGNFEDESGFIFEEI